MPLLENENETTTKKNGTSTPMKDTMILISRIIEITNRKVAVDKIQWLTVLEEKESMKIRQMIEFYRNSSFSQSINPLHPQKYFKLCDTISLIDHVWIEERAN